MKHLQFLERAQINNHLSHRDGETKFGEAVHLIGSLDDLKREGLLFVIIGIIEDIGVRANLGRKGCANAFNQVLGPLCNIQINRFLHAENLALGPILDFKDYMEEAEQLDQNNSQDLKRLRQLTSLIDEEVSQLIEQIAEADLIPIVIGGGHNNSYGIIKGIASKQGQALNVLNIDPHADFRALEGRHSGNGFSYAKAEGALGRYAVFGMHESYNNQAIFEQFRASADLYYLSYDALLTYSTEERDRLFKDALAWLGPDPIGLELDLDSISAFPVSALNASGLTMRQSRGLIKTASALGAPRYFHLAEAAPSLAPSKVEADLAAKSLVYLITDFIKSHHARMY